MSRLKMTVIICLVAYATFAVLTAVTEGLGLAPFMVEHESASGVPYACIYESKQDFITATLDQGDHYHDDTNH